MERKNRKTVTSQMDKQENPERTNEVFLNEEQIIEVNLRGEQNYHSVKEASRRIATLSSDLEEKGMPVNVLVSLAGLEGPGRQESRRGAYEAMKELSYERIAFYGASKVRKYMLDFVLLGTGMGNKLRHFDKRSDAVAWLNEGIPS